MTWVGWLVRADDVWGMLDIQASSAADQLQLHRSQQEATGYLRHLIAAAAGGHKPVLSDAAQAFLGKDSRCRRQAVLCCPLCTLARQADCAAQKHGKCSWRPLIAQSLLAALLLHDAASPSASSA